MSQKFFKGGEVPSYYHSVPIKYTGLRHPNNRNKEFVILDVYPKGTGIGSFLCAWRNGETNKVGIHFTCKAVTKGSKIYFKFKDKLYQYNSKGGFVI